MHFIFQTSKMCPWHLGVAFTSQPTEINFACNISWNSTSNTLFHMLCSYLHLLVFVMVARKKMQAGLLGTLWFWNNPGVLSVILLSKAKVLIDFCCYARITITSLQCLCVLLDLSILHFNANFGVSKSQQQSRALLGTRYAMHMATLVQP